MDANKLRPGHRIIYEGQPCVVLTAQLRQQPRLATKIITKLRNLMTGATAEKVYTSGENVEEAMIENASVKYLYNDGDLFYFMDNESFEQFELPKEKVADTADFLVEDADVSLMRFEGQILSIDVPPTMAFTVVQTDPGVKGDTAQGGSKPATLNTGIVIQVPLFIKEGEKILINTLTREYKERVKE